MYKCEICNKEFEKLKAFHGHQAWHVNRSGLDKIAAKKRGQETIKQNMEIYMINPLRCSQCDKDIPYQKYASKKNQMQRGSKYCFCGSSCAATFNNSRRSISKKTKEKISKTLIKKHKEVKKIRIISKLEIVCSVCSTVFYCTKSKARKNCSDACKNLANSIRRQQYLKENGNFSTPRESFTYQTTTIEVDSNLEKAGIVYLTDVLNAKTIQRFNNLIHYKMDNKKKTYNPDFICMINNQTHIIEVKQKWTSKSEHVYNTSIPYKKLALEDYCKQKGYKYLWLDFDTTPLLKEIYRKILKNRKSSPARI